MNASVDFCLISSTKDGGVWGVVGMGMFESCCGTTTPSRGVHLNYVINSVSLTRRLLSRPSRDLTRHHTSSIIVSSMHSAHHLNNEKKVESRRLLWTTGRPHRACQRQPSKALRQLHPPTPPLFFLSPPSLPPISHRVTRGMCSPH